MTTGKYQSLVFSFDDQSPGGEPRGGVLGADTGQGAGVRHQRPEPWSKGVGPATSAGSTDSTQWLTEQF